MRGKNGRIPCNKNGRFWQACEPDQPQPPKQTQRSKTSIHLRSVPPPVPRTNNTFAQKGLRWSVFHPKIGRYRNGFFYRKNYFFLNSVSQYNPDLSKRIQVRLFALKPARILLLQVEKLSDILFLHHLCCIFLPTCVIIIISSKKLIWKIQISTLLGWIWTLFGDGGWDPAKWYGSDRTGSATLLFLIFL